MSDQARGIIWNDTPFRVLFAGSFFCALAGKIYELTMPLLIYHVSRSPELMGWVRAVELLPYILLGAFIGVWVDRVDRKRWTQWMLLGQMMSLIIAWFALSFLSQPLFVLFPCAFFMMLFNFGYMNARMGILKTILHTSQQKKAASAMSSLTSLLQALGPLISGALLLFSHYNETLIFIAIIIFIAWCLHGKLGYPSQTRNTQGTILQSVKYGLSILCGNTRLLYMSLAVSLFNMCAMVFYIQSLYFVQAHLKLSTFHVGLMVSLGGIGGVIGAVVVNKLRNLLGMGYAFSVSILVQSFSYLMIFFVQSELMFIFSFVWAGFFEAVIGVLVYSLRQESVLAQDLGKVMGITGVLFKLAAPFGLVLSGYSFSDASIRYLLFFCFIIQLLTSSLLVMQRQIRSCK